FVDRHGDDASTASGASSASGRTASGTLAVPGIREELEPSMELIRTISAMGARPCGGSVGLVPTMGALHEGHAALFRAAREECDVVVASVFLNAPQFSDRADLDAYPRDLDRDIAFASEHGVDVVFAPAAGEMYPPGFATWI